MKIYCIEGVNGSGKTTITQKILENLGSTSKPQVTVDPANFTEFGKKIRRVILSTAADKVDANSEALAFCAARLQSVPAITSMSETRSVILERWSGALVAFGLAANADAELLTMLEARLNTALMPSRTFLLDVPGSIAAERLSLIAEKNRFETAGVAWLEKVRQAYLNWAREREVMVIDGTMQPEKVVEYLMDYII